jgi:hypothetical protein
MMSTYPHQFYHSRADGSSSSRLAHNASRHISPYKRGRIHLTLRRHAIPGSSLHLADQRREPKQVRHATVRAPGGQRDERIGFSDIGPRRRQRGQGARVVVVEDSVFTPRLPDRHQLERASGQPVERVCDTEDSLRTFVISRI